jgi:hypothetical protein
MVAPHLLEDPKHGRNPGRIDRALDHAHHRVLIGLDTRWKPQRGTQKLLGAMRRAAHEGLAAEGLDERREVGEVFMGIAPDPTRDGSRGNARTMVLTTCRCSAMPAGVTARVSMTSSVANYDSADRMALDRRLPTTAAMWPRSGGSVLRGTSI